MDLPQLILAMGILLLLSAYFSGSEAALFSLPATRIKVYQNDIDPRKRLIASLLLHPRDLLVTVFMLNTLVNILLQNAAANIFGDLSSWLLKVGVPLLLTLIFGEILPKYLALQHNTSFSYIIAPSITFFTKILKPIRQLAVAITTPLSRAMFFFLKPEPPVSREEIQHLLKTSKEVGVFDADEGELILGYLHLQEALVKELMRPREDILFYDIQQPLTKLTYLFIDQKCTRLPVCDQGLDKVLGIIDAKQFLLHRDSFTHPKELLRFLEKPFYVPEYIPARVLLRRFDEQRQRIALVVDEYGSTSGLITREDLIEVVVGEIADLRDERKLYSPAGNNEIIASGKLEISEFNELFDTNLDSPGGMVTIGGWVTERLGEIPKNGSRYELEGFLFQVLASTPSRVRRLYIRKLSK